MARGGTRALVRGGLSLRLMAVPVLGVDVMASASAFGAVGQGITDEYLRHHCGVDDLDDVTCLTISVNRDEQPVETLGTSCPYLRELKLNDSFVQSIRDLGTGLQNLRARRRASSCVEIIANILKCFDCFVKISL